MSPMLNVDMTYVVLQTLFCAAFSSLLYLFALQNVVRCRNNEKRFYRQLNARTAVQITGVISSALNVVSWLVVYDTLFVTSRYRFLVVSAFSYMFFMVGHFALLFVLMDAAKRALGFERVAKAMYWAVGAIFCSNLASGVFSTLYALVSRKVWPIYVYLGSYVFGEIMTSILFMALLAVVSRKVTNPMMREFLAEFRVLMYIFHFVVLVQLGMLCSYILWSDFFEHLDMAYFDILKEWRHLLEQYVYFILWSYLLWFFWKPLKLIVLPNRDIYQLRRHEENQ